MTKISMLRHPNFLYLYTLPHHDFTHPRVYIIDAPDNAYKLPLSPFYGAD